MTLPVCAETYPSGPITLVNPYAAGGPADVLARTMITPMSDVLGQPIVVLNKPGGATAIAAAFVAASAPDGQTVLMSSASSHIVTPALTKVGYDGMRDFAFVCMIAAVPNVLVVRAGLPVRSVAGAGGARQQTPPASSTTHRSASAASRISPPNCSGNGPGTDITHVPYKGAAPATVDLWVGQIDLAFLNRRPYCRTSRAARCGRWRSPDSARRSAARMCRRWQSSAFQGST